MSDAGPSLHGVVRGSGIEIVEPIGLPEGQSVMVRIEPAPAATAGEGLLRSAGEWSDDPQGLDEFLAWNRRRRNGQRLAIET